MAQSWTGILYMGTGPTGYTGSTGPTGRTGPTGLQGAFFSTLSVINGANGTSLLTPTSFYLGAGGAITDFSGIGSQEGLSLQTNGIYLQIGNAPLIPNGTTINIGLRDKNALYWLYAECVGGPSTTSVQIRMNINNGFGNVAQGSPFTYTSNQILTFSLDGVNASFLLDGVVQLTIPYTTTQAPNPLGFFANGGANAVTYSQVLFYPTGPKGVTGPTGPTGSTLAVQGAGTGSILLKNANDGLVYSAAGLQVLNSGTGGTYLSVSGDLVPIQSLLYNLGSVSNAWNSLYVGTGSIHIGTDVVLSGALIPDAPTGPTGSALTTNVSIIPNAANTLSLGSYVFPWKEMFVGPGSLNIAGPTGAAFATLGSDLAGVAYSQFGFASPFFNVGPEISAVEGAVGGWHISTTGTQGSANFDLVAQQIVQGGTTGSLTGPIYSLTHPQYGTGPTGSTGPTGPTGVTGIIGPQGLPGVSIASVGLTFYVDSSGGTVTAGNPSNSFLSITPNLGAQTTISYTPATSSTNNVLVATFTSAVGALPTTVIPAGLWDLNIYAAASNVSNAPIFYYSVFQVDADGLSNPILIANGSNDGVVISNLQSSQTLYDVALYVPEYTLTDSTKRIQIGLFVNANGGTRTAYFDFRSGAMSHLHTTIAIAIGSTGPTGPTGPVASDALAWTAYTPTFDSSGTTDFGTGGSITGTYKAIGKTVFFNIRMVIGTSPSFGTGVFKFGLPVAAVNSNTVVASSTYLDNQVNWYFGVANSEYSGSASTVTALYTTGTVVTGATAAAAVDATRPFTWGDTDTLTISGTYQSV